MLPLPLEDMIRLLFLFFSKWLLRLDSTPQELRGGGTTVISRAAFILCHKATFYYHWHGDEETDYNPPLVITPKATCPACALFRLDLQLFSQAGFVQPRLHPENGAPAGDNLIGWSDVCLIIVSNR